MMRSFASCARRPILLGRSNERSDAKPVVSVLYWTDGGFIAGQTYSSKYWDTTLT
jgi:hypothetical protein